MDICQALLSMGFSRQGYQSGYPFPSPEDLPNPGTEPESPRVQADTLPLSHQGSPCGYFQGCILSSLGMNFLYICQFPDDLALYYGLFLPMHDAHRMDTETLPCIVLPLFSVYSFQVVIIQRNPENVLAYCMTMKLLFLESSHLLEAFNWFIQVFATSIYCGFLCQLAEIKYQNLNKYLSLLFFVLFCLSSSWSLGYKIPRNYSCLILYFVEIQQQLNHKTNNHQKIIYEQRIEICVF